MNRKTCWCGARHEERGIYCPDCQDQYESEKDWIECRSSGISTKEEMVTTEENK